MLHIKSNNNGKTSQMWSISLYPDAFKCVNSGVQSGHLGKEYL